MLTLEPSITASQAEDLDIKPILVAKENKLEKPTWEIISRESVATKAYWSQWDQLDIVDGVLVCKWQNKYRLVHQIVFPCKLRNQVLHGVHDNRAVGHLGVAKTTGRLNERFYWYGRRSDVKSLCRFCNVCAVRKMPAQKPRAPI